MKNDTVCRGWLSERPQVDAQLAPNSHLRRRRNSTQQLLRSVEFAGAN